MCREPAQVLGMLWYVSGILGPKISRIISSGFLQNLATILDLDNHLILNSRL